MLLVSLKAQHKLRLKTEGQEDIIIMNTKKIGAIQIAITAPKTCKITREKPNK